MTTSRNIFNELIGTIKELTIPAPDVFNSEIVEWRASERPFWGKIGKPMATTPVLMNHNYFLEARKVRRFPFPQYRIFSVHNKYSSDNGLGMRDYLYLTPDGRITNCTNGTYQEFFSLEQAKKIMREEGVKRANNQVELRAEIGTFLMPYDFRSEHPSTTQLTLPDAANKPPQPT